MLDDIPRHAAGLCAPCLCEHVLQKMNKESQNQRNHIGKEPGLGMTLPRTGLTMEDGDCLLPLAACKDTRGFKSVVFVVRQWTVLQTQSRIMVDCLRAGVIVAWR